MAIKLLNSYLAFFISFFIQKRFSNYVHVTGKRKFVLSEICITAARGNALMAPQHFDQSLCFLFGYCLFFLFLFFYIRLFFMCVSLFSFSHEQLPICSDP